MTCRIDTEVIRSEPRHFVERYLNPASRLGEILFGLIMVLTMTLTAGLSVGAGREGVRELLLAALGCNIAWGLIDAVMYVMNCMTERAEKARLIEAVQHAPDADTALEIVRNEIEPRFEAFTGREDREALCRSIVEYLGDAKPVKTTVTMDDLYGAAACFWLVVVSCLPAAIPFFVFDEPIRALRVSNFLLIAMLFVVGHKWAQYVHTSRMIAGTVMVAIGLALVGVAVLLGG